MLVLGIGIGIFLGSFITLIIYACILCGKKADETMIKSCKKI